ncbi:MAG: VanZ family protein [Eubacterium sp.]|nr:VanZ family protein [Eubacterium sp.]
MVELFEPIRKDIIEVFQYVPRSIIIGIIAGIFVQIIYWSIGKQRAFFKNAVPVGLLAAYMAQMLQIAFFSREAGTRTTVSLKLFETWTPDAQGRAYVIENILFFVPFAILLCICLKVLGRHRLWIVPIAGALLSLSIETMQLIAGRGYFQVDDIATNIVGTVVGLIIFWCIKLICKKVLKEQKEFREKV